MTPAAEASLRGRLRLAIRGPWADPAVTADDCWVFTARWRSRFGYGRIRAAGHLGKQLQAHIAMYLLERGPYPQGLVLDHTCHNTACCNPGHLVPSTYRQNAQTSRRWAPTVPLAEVEAAIDAMGDSD